MGDFPVKYLKVFLILPLLFLFSCGKDIPEEDVFDNPLDEEEVTYETPALTFYPVDIIIDLGSSSTVDVFVLGVENLAGSYVRISYDKLKLQVLSMTVGEFFAILHFKSRTRFINQRFSASFSAGNTGQCDCSGNYSASSRTC